MMNNVLNRLAISDEGFVFDPLTGISYTVNPTARHILDQLIAGNSYDETLNEFTAIYNVEQDIAERDFGDFMQQLRSLQLI